MTALRKATRQKAKIRLGLSAVAGGGKTYTGLLIAYGMTGDWEKIAIIDTENGSGDLYSHLGPYNVLPLNAPYNPEKYVEAIKACEKAGMEVIIVDSITHEWEGKGGCLELVDQITNASQSKNSYTAWGRVTPRHQAFIDAMLSSSAHIITTVRRKQDYEMVKEGNKIKVEKAGLKEITRDGWEYELTINLQLDTAHMATASKDRTGLFMGKPEFIPSIETGELIKNWCESGAEPLQQEVKPEIEALRKATPAPIDGPATSPAPTDEDAIPGAWLRKSEKWETVESVLEDYKKATDTVNAHKGLFEMVFNAALEKCKSLQNVILVYTSMKPIIDASPVYKAIISSFRDQFTNKK